MVAFLDESPSGHPQAPFDPNNLPFLNLQPLPDNTPRIQAEQFQADFPDVVAAMNDEALANDQSSPTPRGTESNAFDNPQWLSTSDEVVLTDAILAQAAELDNDPVQIYHWVRNTIDWIPTWGAQQDADITLGSQRGNAFDQASLLIALRRKYQDRH